MNKISLIIILFSIFPDFIIAQPIVFKNEKVDTIIIESAENHYAYGDAQTNKEDKLVITYAEKRKTYQIVNYERIISNYPANHGYPKVTKKSKPTFIRRKKLEANLNLLIENIDTSHFPIQITDYYKKRKIQQKITFWKVLKVYQKKWKIEDFLDIEIAYDSYKECKKIEDLDSLLNERVKYHLFRTHSNSLFITIKTESNNHLFISSPQALRQPFSKSFDENYVNININTALLAILPKGFVEREGLLLEDLIESYLYWKI